MSKTAQKPSDRIAAITERTDELSRRWAPAVLRWTAALLWLSNLSWKVPTAFGRTADGCGSLCAYVNKGIEFRVLPGSPWVFENLVAPNLSMCGWITLFVDATLVALLLSFPPQCPPPSQ